MKLSTIIWTVVWVTIIGAIIGVIWYDETVAQPAKAAARAALSIEERYGLESVCLNGVEYWMNTGTDSRSWMLTPKYSPGSATPNTCSG